MNRRWRFSETSDVDSERVGRGLDATNPVLRDDVVQQTEEESQEMFEKGWLIGLLALKDSVEMIKSADALSDEDDDDLVLWTEVINHLT